jgi:hypothetical protein
MVVIILLLPRLMDKATYTNATNSVIIPIFALICAEE